MITDWRAKWIWACGQRETPNFHVYARREFETHGASTATVSITCSSEYRLYINGRYVGRGLCICDSAAQYYDRYDVTHVIRPGKNVLAVLCYNYGVDTQFGPRTPGGLLLQLDAHNGNGGSFTLGTDETWRVLPGQDWDSGSARMSDDLGFQEVYDSRLKPVGWNVVGFDDSQWQEPEVIGDAAAESWASLVLRDIPRLREREVYPERIVGCGVVLRLDSQDLDVATRMQCETRRADTSSVRYPNSVLRPSADTAVVVPGGDSFMTVDFGREVVGYPILRIRDGGTGVIDIGYSESLDESGEVDPARQGVLQADRLILHGGRQEWQTLGRRAFRYAQLTFRDHVAPLRVESISVDSVGYPVEQVSTFDCSDDLLNRTWQTGLHTLSLCMQDHYESSPLVGRSQKISDTRLQALINYYTFHDAKLVAKTLRRLAGRQDEDGLLWVIALHDYHLHIGDRPLVERLYPEARLLMTGYDSEDGPPTVVALHYQALRDTAKLASAVGEIEDTILWHDRAEQVLRSFNDRFWSEDHCAYEADLYTNGLAVLFGLADSRRCGLISRLFESRADDLRSVKPAAAFYLLQAMAKLGMDAEAIGLVRGVWGGMLERGATTWWESSDPASPGSFCHGASGAPTFFLPAEVLGVKPSMPESDVVVIQPRPGDLEWARGRITTKGQTVEVEWHSAPGSLTLSIAAPEGFVAALPVRGFRNPLVEEIDMGPDTPERRARKTYGWGNVIWRDGEERDPYLDWLDAQDEKPPPSYSSRWRCSVEDGYIWVRECAHSQVRYEVREFGA